MAMQTSGTPHFSGQPKLAKLTWRPIAESATRVVELKTGNAQLVTPIDPIQVPEVQAEPTARVVTFRQISSQVVVLNQQKVKPFADKAVRQALNYATDVDTLVKSVMQGAAYRLAGPFGPGLSGYDDTLQPYPYDPDKARSLLAQAGFPNGFEVTLVSPDGRYLNDKLASQAIASMWSKVGVNTKVQVMEWSQFVQGVVTGKSHDAFYFQQGGIPLDATVSVNFHSGKKGAAWQGYTNPEADRIIDDAVRTLDAEKRNTMYKQLARTIYEDAPWVFLWNQQGIYGLQKRVQAWEPHVDGIIRLGGLSLA
jgi:peptide/nickel transport system substrate-binding protein